MTAPGNPRESGFTLLELLIVIVIIGILALLILPNLTSAPEKARDTKRKTDLVAIQHALEEYFLDNNAYPSNLSSLTVGTAPWLKAVPKDPKNVSPFVYQYIPANSDSTYTLTACLENNLDTGTDVIAPVSPCSTKTFELISEN